MIETTEVYEFKVNFEGKLVCSNREVEQKISQLINCISLMHAIGLTSNLNGKCFGIYSIELIELSSEHFILKLHKKKKGGKIVLREEKKEVSQKGKLVFGGIYFPSLN